MCMIDKCLIENLTRKIPRDKTIVKRKKVLRRKTKLTKTKLIRN